MQVCILSSLFAISVRICVAPNHRYITLEMEEERELQADRIKPELSTGHFFWTRPNPTRRNVDPTRDCWQNVWPDPTRDPTRPLYV